MIGRLIQLLEPRLRQQAGIEKSKTLVERDILVQWVRNSFIVFCAGPIFQPFFFSFLLQSDGSYLNIHAFNDYGDRILSLANISYDFNSTHLIVGSSYDGTHAVRINDTSSQLIR